MKNTTACVLFLFMALGMGIPVLSSTGKIDFAMSAIGAALVSGGAVHLSLKYDNSVLTTIFIWWVLTKLSVDTITMDEPDREERAKQAVFIVTLNSLGGLIGASFGEEKNI